MADVNSSSELPLKMDVMNARAVSVFVAFLMGILSLAGLLFSDRLYPSEEQVQSFLANDVVNLLIGVPMLLGSIWLTRRARVVGLLLWPGALLYVAYIYLVYAFGRPVDWLTPAYVALVVLSAYNTRDLMTGIDRESVRARLNGAVPVRLTGWVLVVFGGAFFFRAAGVLAGAIVEGNALPLSEIGLLVADLAISALWIAGGIAMLRRKAIGYVSGLGLLFAASMLFVGLIVVFLLQPVLVGGPLALVDVIVVTIMGMICFIPSGLYLRGILSV
jgi:hypothetical protein